MPAVRGPRELPPSRLRPESDTQPPTPEPPLLRVENVQHADWASPEYLEDDASTIVLRSKGENILRKESGLSISTRPLDSCEKIPVLANTHTAGDERIQLNQDCEATLRLISNCCCANQVPFLTAVILKILAVVCAIGSQCGRKSK
jgi:hypothetical protein